LSFPSVLDLILLAQRFPFLSSSRSTSTRLTTTTSMTTMTSSTTTISSAFEELVINDVSYNPNGMLTITWDYMLTRLPKYYHLQIYDQDSSHVLLQRLIDGEQRSIEIDIKDNVQDPSSSYIICLNVRQRKYCRNLHLQPVKSTSMILSSTKDEHPASLQFVYLLSGVCLGALLVSVILIIVCCWRVRYFSRVERTKSPVHSSIFYRPLNIISYPQQQQQQQTASCDTSECSIHSSTDTSQLASDSYHIYQQIPSVYNCHMHPTRTHILV
jgi:hypothetical protein